MVPRSLVALLPSTLAFAAVTGGCAVADSERGADETLTAEVPEAFSAAGDAALAERWWAAFEDPVLDALVGQALEANFDLAVAWQRLAQARAVVDREAAALQPELDATAEAGLRRPGTPDTESVTLGLRAAYEVDLWGGIDAAVDAERLRAEATRADYRTAALSLSAEVTLTWYQLREARAQVELLTAQERTNAQVLELIRARVGTGQVRGVDILRQRQLIESTRARRIVAETRVAVLEHLLAVLLGRAPQQGIGVADAGASGESADPDADPMQVKALPDLPPLPAAGVPADLLQRRPDLQRALLLVRAADEDVAVAVTARYPRLSLSASLTTSSDGADTLFEDWARSLAANLVAPLLDGGRRGAEVDRARALAEQRVAEYGQAALTAFREVEDALVQESKQVERIASLERQVELGERTYEQLRSEYFNGLADYIDVLATLTNLQENRRDLLSARLTLMEARIALYRALAGGFETAREREDAERDEAPAETDS
jgi:NodT family efflux transporter outer membrane factor (OMF) lipoprotein